MPPGLLIVADQGYAGQEVETFGRELGAMRVRPDRRDERRRDGQLGSRRRRVHPPGRLHLGRSALARPHRRQVRERDLGRAGRRRDRRDR
jgi:hypothetical protein